MLRRTCIAVADDDRQSAMRLQLCAAWPAALHAADVDPYAAYDILHRRGLTIAQDSGNS